ncbi:hypothetical protein AOQ84DRAFT_351571 [Glonium stellatum]|uniref:Fucose-specific lectin n=1 Tax=Glonium stellatum TaxID=574774 RepID=A0A8E2FBU7_9PEZI|nr:hypothetical protein AOQ84DRAFT_351571 [Glonium stellatum]
MANTSTQSAESGGSLIQGTFGTEGSVKNFEVAVLEFDGSGGKQLVHHSRDNSKPDKPWGPPTVISTKATTNGALIESSYGNLEVVVNEGGKIAHYSRIDTKWEFQTIINKSGGATGAPAIIQSTYGTPEGPGNFEALIPCGKTIQHWSRDNSDDEFPWRHVHTFSNAATSNACIIQSTIKDVGKAGNLEAVVLEGSDVVLYTLAGTDWKKNPVPISTHGVDSQPGALMQSTYVQPSGTIGNYEFILLAANPNSPVVLEHWWRNNTDPARPWTRAKTIDVGLTSSGALMQSSYGNPGQPGNFEIVVHQGGNLVHYWRNNSDGSEPWIESGVVTPNAVPN